jgi:predicted TPR repeat methyltransferase
LEVGCGKGFAGLFFKEEGFQNIHGIDPSNTLLSIARQRKIYKSLERVIFGLQNMSMPTNYIN